MCRIYPSFLQMSHVFLSFSPVLHSFASRTFLVPELTSILTRDPEQCKMLLVLMVLHSLSVGIRWVSINALVFGRELRIYSFVFLKPRRILYACLQSYSVKVNFNFMGHSLISLFCLLSIFTIGVCLTTGTESLPKRYPQRRRFSAPSFSFHCPLGRNFFIFLIL
jgi:hypothetical protein